MGTEFSPKKSLKTKWCKACAGVSLFIGIVSIVLGILVLLFFRDFVDGLIKSEITLREGSRFAEVWAKPPIKPYLKVYFFNVTNPRRFLKGAKPRLREVGPFVYEEVWEKVNITWSANGDRVEFGQKKTYFFRRDLSVADESEILTLPNIPMLTSLASLKGTDETDFVRIALGSMLEILKQEPFVNLSASDILWGYENPLIKLGRDILPDDQKFPFDEFGFFIGKNGTAPGLLTTKTGVNDINNVGQVTAWDGETELKFWKTDECNAIHGTDGSIFKPDILRNDTLYIFNRDICQALPMVYQKDVDHDGVATYRFTPPEDVFARPEEKQYNDCFCLVEGGCDVPHGLFNMSACQFGSPVLLSWPHFYQADPKLLDDVIGLRPVKEKHEFYMDVQPKLGSSLSAQARTQINIAIYKADDLKQAQGLRDIIFPVLWFAEGIESIEDAETLNLFHTAVNTPEKARSALYPTFFVAGVVLILFVLIVVGYNNNVFTCSEVRTEEITPPHKNGKNGAKNGSSNGHYEMRTNGGGVVLASS